MMLSTKPGAVHTTLTTRPPLDAGGCDWSGSGTTTTRTYDAADRLTDAGYTYDALGRITAVPAADAGGSAITPSYYVNDLVRSLAQGATTRTWTLDPARRFRSWSDNGGAATTNHYVGDTDSPSWVAEADGSWTRNIAGIDGDLAAIQGSASGMTLQLANLHGDLVATASTDPAATGPLATFEADEFGRPRAGTSGRYEWLGAKQRQTDSLTGIVLMGVRLYVPVLGRFLQVDPIPGGGANAYDYAYQDPIGKVDLDGQAWGWLRKVAKVAIFVGGVVAAGACGATIACGIAVGAAVGAASYAASNVGTRRFSWEGVARHGVIGGAIGGLTYGLGGRLAFRAPGIGARSRLFGDIYSGAAHRGLLNPAGRSARWALGWSGKSAVRGGSPAARTVFRAKIFGRHLDLLNGPWR